MGVAPIKQTELDTPNAVGGKLMLVHGYCSGDAWGSAASAGQFTNYVKFLDLNQNRSHDQFAQRIRNFGSTLPSFGIVAHSQGGAASLHLYTYYWSGLDSATGGTRLIQSVGTPYQGTALAGNLAAIGSVFGAGCGTNNDLTYSGAAAWLANIPTWARGKVYYHTTSFTVGKQGDLVEVKPGYARNYLLPYGKAVVPTTQNLRTLETYKIKVQKARDARVADLKVLAEQLTRLPTIIIEANATEEGHLYGSIGPVEISKTLKAKNLGIEPDMVKMEHPIKEANTATAVPLNLGYGIEAKVEIAVVALQTVKK